MTELRTNLNGRRPARRAEHMGEPEMCEDPVSLRPGERASQGWHAPGFQAQQECGAQKVWSNPDVHGCTSAAGAGRHRSGHPLRQIFFGAYVKHRRITNDEKPQRKE